HGSHDHNERADGFPACESEHSSTPGHIRAGGESARTSGRGGTRRCPRRDREGRDWIEANIAGVCAQRYLCCKDVAAALRQRFVNEETSGFSPCGASCDGEPVHGFVRRIFATVSLADPRW